MFNIQQNERLSANPEDVKYEGAKPLIVRGIHNKCEDNKYIKIYDRCGNNIEIESKYIPEESLFSDIMELGGKREIKININAEGLLMLEYYLLCGEWEGEMLDQFKYFNEIDTNNGTILEQYGVKSFCDKYNLDYNVIYNDSDEDDDEYYDQFYEKYDEEEENTFKYFGEEMSMPTVDEKYLSKYSEDDYSDTESYYSY